MKITTIAQASQCAKKLANGKSCSAAEMKATIQLLNSGLNAARVATRTAKREAREAKAMVASLLSRINPF